MQGGPGGPSTFGASDEIGNWYVNAKHEIKERAYSWCRENSCLFVDSPTMTGFTYQTDLNYTFQGTDKVEYATNSADIAGQLVEVFKQFLYVWPEHSHSPFHVTGESYGGNYCPNYAKKIADERNKPKPVDAWGNVVVMPQLKGGGKVKSLVSLNSY